MGKRKHRVQHAAPRAAADSERAWWTKFQEWLSCLHQSKQGCRHCTGGSCYAQFQDAGLQEQLREWHQQWATMGAETQDSHLLWMFHADRTVAGAEITLPHGQKKRRRVSRASGEEVSDDRISTSSVDSWSSRRSCAEDQVATDPRNQRRAAFRTPRSSLRNAQAWWTSPRAWTNPSRGGGVTSTTMVRHGGRDGPYTSWGTRFA